MPTEIRKITFSRDELQSAVVSHCLHHRGGFPKAPISGMYVTTKAKEAVTLSFDSAAGKDVPNVILNQSEAAAALISYCRDLRMPLPHFASKVLEPKDDGIVMLIKFGWDELKGKKVPPPDL